MMLQPGFFVLAFYLAWIYALVVLVTLVSRYDIALTLPGINTGVSYLVH